MDINKKILWGFVLLGAIGIFAIFLFKTTPDYGIKKENFQIKDIQKVVITNCTKKTVKTLTDSIVFKPIIDNMLIANEIEINNTKSRIEFYNVEIFFINNKKINFKINNSPSEGFWFRVIHRRYNGKDITATLNNLTI